MSSATADTHSNIKQVMRTALVGISPADQLMLKGYLRVLLRLEADLEWVPANHPEVDLLFINEEFRASDSVKRLMSISPDKPVLFVQRDQNGNGGLHEDILTIPLKELTLLSKWLMGKVSVLSANNANVADKRISGNSSSYVSNRVDNPNQASTTSNTAQTSSSSFSSSSASSPSRQPQSTTHHSKSPFESSATNAPYNGNLNDNASKEPKDLMFAGSTSSDYDGLIEFAKLASERPSGLYELIINDVRVGLVNLERQRLWLNIQLAVFDKTWQLKRVSENEPDTTPVDFYQWLWSKAWESPREILPLISDSQKYQIRYWPKPTDISNRSNLLRVFTALETQPITVSEAASLAETSVNSVKKVLAGLLVSGGLKQEAYAQLSASSMTKSSQASQSPSTSAADTKVSNSFGSQQPQSGGRSSALEDAIQRKASGQSTPISSSVEIKASPSQSPQIPPQPQVTAQPKTEKGGFLSRLRKKLGL